MSYDSSVMVRSIFASRLFRQEKTLLLVLILLDAPPSEKVRIQVKVNVKVIAYWGTRQQRQGHIGNIV